MVNLNPLDEHCSVSRKGQKWSICHCEKEAEEEENEEEEEETEEEEGEEEEDRAVTPGDSTARRRGEDQVTGTASTHLDFYKTR